MNLHKRVINFSTRSTRSTLTVAGITVALVVGLSLLHLAGKQVQAQDAFGVASIRGTYAFTSTNAANAAGQLGVFRADGNGNFTVTGVYNLGAPFGGRQSLAFTEAGTYSINADGTGSARYTLSLGGGGPVPSTADFVITLSNGFVATEVVMLQREPVGGGGELGRIVLQRRP